MINLDKYVGKLFNETVCEIAVDLGLDAEEEVNTVVVKMVENGYYPCIECWKVYPLVDFPDRDKDGTCKHCKAIESMIAWEEEKKYCGDID